MSLDKQRILNELGSVVNQLQSADCGCMGKLFSNQNQGANNMASPMTNCGGCRRGCCHGNGFGYSTPCSGEPFSMNNTMNRSCMGQCNPPKFYSDTYNYLNDNLMKPVMKEVYDDLKSITPDNTIMNNPLAAQMGLSPGNPGAVTQGNNPSGTLGMQNMPGMDSNNASSNVMGGMGPQIVNMMMEESRSKSSNVPKMQGGQLTGPTVTPPSPHSQIGLPSNNSPLGGNQEQNTGNMNSSFNQQGNIGSYYSQNPTTQYMTQQPNMYSGANGQGSPMMGNINQNTAPQGTQQIGNMNNAMISGNPQMNSPNSAAQQMTPVHGQHSQGMMKFNEMFPGIMQGGDLGFDPMAIAIQMNPANQQKAAMSHMEKLMTGGRSRGMGSSVMKPIMDAAKPAVQSINEPNTVSQDQQNVTYANQMSNQQMPNSQQNSDQNAGVFNSQPTAVPQHQQQVYTAVTGSSVPNSQQWQTQMQAYQQQSNPMQQYYQPQTQYITDPNTGAISTLPSMTGGYEGMTDPNVQMQSVPSEQTAPPTRTTPQPMIKDPILPVDISKNRSYTYSKPVKYLNYNTLGQPVEMLPARMFHPPEPGLPQTLSPQPATKLRNDYMRFSNVKPTISKTSLMGNRPVGRIPSRNQLQHIYNQYRGSQSFTQQNVRPPAQGGTFSEGKLNIPASNNIPSQQIKIEKVGGDTAANNTWASNQMQIKDPGMGRNIIGDIAVPNMPQGDVPLKPSSPVPARQAKLRNGLQDVVYTSYPTSAAWTFHGANTNSPIASVGYRFRNIR